MDITAIYVDGCMNSRTGENGWSFVCDQKRRDIINIVPVSLPLLTVDTPTGIRQCIPVRDEFVKEQQNNYAELVALTVGLRIALTYNVKEIYSDSQVVREYWSLGRVNKKLEMGENKRQWLKVCQALRKEYESKGGKVLKVSGKANLADPGWH